MAFALIDPRGRVAQLADESFDVHESFKWADVSNADPTPEPGWTATFAIGGDWTFTSPPAPNAPAPATTMTPLEFMARFTSSELAAVATGAQGNALLLLWMMQCAAASLVDLDDPRTADGLTALVNAGILTPARRHAIISP